MSASDAVHGARATAIHDLIGIGFGPSHLALAIESERCRADDGPPLEDLYFDLREDFCWHPGMLLDDSRLQVVFLKDLVTMRDPCSRYTFINYLFQNDRLHEFINLRTFYPTRIEFNDYYHWVAEHFRARVRYRHEVVEVTPASAGNGVIELLEVRVRELETGRESLHRCRNLSLGMGGRPRVPPGVEVTPEGRIFHSSDCLQRLERDFPDRQAAYRLVVVGAGQTAADIFYYLIRHYPNAHIVSSFRGFAFKPQDDTHFVNELFFPRAVDLFYGLPEEKRRDLLLRHRDVTHSAVDMDLLPLIYDEIYQDKMMRRNRLELLPFHQLEEARDGAEATLVFRDLHSDERREVKADAVVLSTGYDRTPPAELLAPLASYLRTDERGDLRVSRRYAIESHDEFHPRIYLQGYCEPTHGFSEVLLSLLPIRAAEIAEDLRVHPSPAGLAAPSKRRRDERRALTEAVT